ncbi:MAG: hypothetical protein EAX95_15670 [Candidatus Thorarchaeota archaeon]|nr:hypothetical protein [Candidatus Thorarchaeota archaeon]
MLEVGAFYLGMALGFDLLLYIIAKVTGATPQRFFSQAQGKTAALSAYLEYSLFANSIIGVIGIALIANAIIHWSQAF